MFDFFGKKKIIEYVNQLQTAELVKLYQDIQNIMESVELESEGLEQDLWDLNMIMLENSMARHACRCILD